MVGVSGRDSIAGSRAPVPQSGDLAAYWPVRGRAA